MVIEVGKWFSLGTGDLLIYSGNLIAISDHLSQDPSDARTGYQTRTYKFQICTCGRLNVFRPHKLLGSGTIKRCDFVE